MISDGDGQYLPGIDHCEWLIAPTGADHIHFRFIFYDMSPDFLYNWVEIDVCQDIACADSSPLPGSPFLENTGEFLPRDIVTGSTGFARVRFPALWSGHTQARFVLYYSTNSNISDTSSGLMMGSWNHISAVVESYNESSFVASVFVNGLLYAGPVFSYFGNASGLAFAGQYGIAIGRTYPMSAPFGYFRGYIDELVVLDHFVSGNEVMSLMQTPCSKVPHSVLCFAFDRATISANGSWLDAGSGMPADAISVSQDRFMPSCTTRNDGGELVLDYISNEHPYGSSWGFCTSKARLPGAGFEYDAETLELLTKTFEVDSEEFPLKNLPGCSNFPLIMDNNYAGRYVTNDSMRMLGKVSKSKPHTSVEKE